MSRPWGRRTAAKSICQVRSAGDWRASDKPPQRPELRRIVPIDIVPRVSRPKAAAERDRPVVKAMRRCPRYEQSLMLDRWQRRVAGRLSLSVADRAAGIAGQGCGAVDVSDCAAPGQPAGASAPPGCIRSRGHHLVGDKQLRGRRLDTAPSAGDAATIVDRRHARLEPRFSQPCARGAGFRSLTPSSGDPYPRPHRSDAPRSSGRTRGGEAARMADRRSPAGPADQALRRRRVGRRVAR